MKCAGLIIDDSPHYLDHLAPFCTLLGWPLIVCEESIAKQCRRFYPQVELILIEFMNLSLPPCVVSCDSRAMLSSSLGLFKPWNGRLIWLPHGLSDKGWKSPFFEALGTEDLLLVYGQRMRDVLSIKGVNVPRVSIGNFRLQFYQECRSFYDGLVKERFGDRRFILYAPTWEDSEDNGTFWEAFPRFLGAVPLQLHLLIKIHPNTEKRFGPKLERCRAIAESHPNISLIDDFLPIYPLLSRTDAYIGDMSSIGYDFLAFHKPLFFLRRETSNSLQGPSSFLMQCGEQIPIEEIPQLFKRPCSYSTQTKQLFDQSFDSICWKKVAKRLQKQVDAWI